MLSTNARLVLPHGNKTALGYQNPFYLKQAQQKQQSLYDGKVLLEKHDPPAVHDSEETLQLALEKAAKFVRDFKSLAKEADESLAKHKALELEIERLLRAVVSQDIMSIVQNPSVVESSNIQTELDRTKERFEKYAKLWNDWYKKCKECKYDKISYDKAYNDVQQKIKRLQAQLGDLKGKSEDTLCVSDTLDPLSQKLQNKNVELEFQIAESNDLLNPVTSNSVPTTTESKVVTNSKVISPGMFWIHSFKTSREDKFMPINKVRASVKTNPIIVSQPNVITKKHVNSDSNGLSFTGVDNTAKTRRPQPRSNTKNNRVPSASKSSCIKNKEVEVEEHHRNLLLSKNKKHMSFECNNVKLVIRNDKSEVMCAMCCSKHMTGNLKLLINFVLKFLGTVLFGNDHVSAIMDLEVAFRRNTCFVKNLEGVDLLKGNHTTNLYTINLYEMASASPIYLMARATSTRSWLWHQRLSHLNFDTINDLAKNNIFTGLPKFKYHKEHLCPSCEQEKSKKASHPPKPVPNSKQRLHLLYMDLCGLMRVESINGKRYILDASR
ncbi:retrovirus-related pol polyprotein from transposon TNT 1-94 [Tanacetum coccineum]